ncbi:MAG: hypothetical protein NTW86_21110, partial [Candidatus Sumerlaeota bacterium]|nr:hypothetical protein [Candidatus Sumerlaeota bacterium]
YAAYQAWRIGYYGDVFPNTFYAKVAGRAEAAPFHSSAYCGAMMGAWWAFPALVAQFVFDVRRRNVLPALLFGMAPPVSALRVAVAG